jgi:hypothetical protein
MQTIPQHILDRPLSGYNITDSSLRAEIGNAPTLLVFLRHFGCIFCRELAKDLKTQVEAKPNYPSVMFFYQGQPQEGAAFFDAIWPTARAVSDVPKVYYDAFGIDRGGLKQMFGPAVWACGVRAALKGNFIGWKTGDPWTMPGMFLVQGTQIVWNHDFRHAGDHPDLSRIPAFIPA